MSRRIKRVRTVGRDNNEIHLGAQVDEIARPLAGLLPGEATAGVKRYGREERDAGRNIPDIEPDLGSGRQKIIPRFARRFAGCSKRRGRRRAADQKIMRAAGILDQREHDAPHVREDHAALRNRGAPLHLDGIGAIDPLGGILLAPREQRYAGAAGVIDDPKGLAASQAQGRVPAARHPFPMYHGLRRNRRTVKRGRLGQSLWRELLSSRAKLLVAAPIGLGDFLPGLDHPCHLRVAIRSP